MTNQSTGITAGFGPIRYLNCSVTGYLEEAYLGFPYLGTNTGYLGLQYLSGPYLFFDLRCGHLGIEGLQTIDFEDPLGIEGIRTIDFEEPLGIEGLQAIDFEYPLGIEIIRFHADPTGISGFISIYNVDLLRVLCQFDSRGTVLNNWTVVSGGQAAGDFSIQNINTDIWEEVYRSVSTLITIDSDTGVISGSRPDTLWIGNHNLTTGATITVVGSDDPTFTSPKWSFIFPEVTREQVFYILPDEDFPLAGVRYVRFIISDLTNPDGYLQFAHLLFGAAIVFNGDCITDSITKQIVHFKDEIPTEGFTSVMNDRALRKKVSFSFQNLAVGKGNYSRLVDVFLSAKTDLKCLWIPYPRQPTRFGVFAKLTEIPAETHNIKGSANQDLDFVSFDISVDEAL